LQVPYAALIMRLCDYGHFGRWCLCDVYAVVMLYVPPDNRPTL